MSDQELFSQGGAGLAFGDELVSRDVAHALACHMVKGGDPTTDNYVAHSLRTDGFDASEDGTGRGTPLVPAVAPVLTSNYGKQPDNSDTSAGPMLIAFTSKDHDADAGEVAPTLRGMGHDKSHANGGGQIAVAFGWQNSAAQGASASAEHSPTLDKSKTPAVGIGMAVRRLTPRECSRLQGFPDDYLELDRDADAEEARSREVLRRVWGASHQEANGVTGRLGELAALLSPEILLAGVFLGWIPWSVAGWCATSGRALPGAFPWPQAAVRVLRFYAERGPSPYGREPAEQLARELGGSLPILPHEGTPWATALLAAVVRQTPSSEGILRHALSAVEETWRSTGGGWKTGKRIADGPRYKALGNSMAANVMRWIGYRIAAVETIA